MKIIFFILRQIFSQPLLREHFRCRARFTSLTLIPTLPFGRFGTRFAWRFIAGRRFLFIAIFLALFSSTIFPQSQTENSEIPYTAEEPPKFFSFSSSEFPKIENPNRQAPISERRAASEEELEKIRIQNEKIRAENEIWSRYQKDLQLQNKIKNLPKNFKKTAEKPANLFYIYDVKKDESKYLDTFNGLYARFQTGQGTLATINRISSPDSVKVGTRLILPIQQGLYIPKKSENTLEILLQKEYAPLITDDTKIYEIDGTEFYFLPDRTFSPTQIAFFHDTGMQLPLSKKIVTSEFGYRTSPISGKWKFHAGIDLAAPIGTEVFACKSGTVAIVGYNDIYGNYIDIKHSGNTVSRYAHLSKTLVKRGQTVSTGQTIGLVGTTGASTGPHLHFEVRENGTPTDPTKQIRNF